MKKHGWKDLVLGVVLMALVMGLAAPALAMTGKKQMEVDYMDIKLTVDGVPVGGLVDSNGNTVQPFACEGTTYLPVRAVGEALGKEVKWDGPTRTVYITDPAEPKAMTVSPYYGASARKETIDVDYLDIKLVVDGKEVTPKDVNGKVVEPFAYNGTTFLPVRAVGEALGKTVRWDSQTKTVHLGELPQGTYLVDVCKVAGQGSSEGIYRAADGKVFENDGKRYSQGFWTGTGCVVFELGGKYESLTFDLFHDDNENQSLEIYVDGELTQSIVMQGNDMETVHVPLNYAQTVAFYGTERLSPWMPAIWVANAVLNGERTVSEKPAPPANATYLVDELKGSIGFPTYRAAEEDYFEDIFGNKYTNGIKVNTYKNKEGLSLNGKYKTLKATIIKNNRAYGENDVSRNKYEFFVDGEVVKEIDLSNATGPKAIEIPLNYGMKLEFSEKSEFFLADAILE